MAHTSPVPARSASGRVGQQLAGGQDGRECGMHRGKAWCHPAASLGSGHRRPSEVGAAPVPAPGCADRAGAAAGPGRLVAGRHADPLRRPQPGQSSASGLRCFRQAKLQLSRHRSCHRPRFPARQSGQYRDPWRLPHRVLTWTIRVPVMVGHHLRPDQQLAGVASLCIVNLTRGQDTPGTVSLARWGTSDLAGFASSTCPPATAPRSRPGPGRGRCPGRFRRSSGGH
jgi:hypothetical protein